MDRKRGLQKMLCYLNLFFKLQKNLIGMPVI